MAPPVRILVIGDGQSGKSSLISSFVSERFPATVPHLLPDMSIPENVSPFGANLTIMDSSAEDVDRQALISKIRRADSIILLHDLTQQNSLAHVKDIWLPLLENEFLTMGQEIDGDDDNEEDPALRCRSLWKPVVLAGSKYLDEESKSRHSKPHDEHLGASSINIDDEPIDMLTPILDRYRVSAFVFAFDKSQFILAYVKISCKTPLNVGSVFSMAYSNSCHSLQPLIDISPLVVADEIVGGQISLSDEFIRAIHHIFRIYDTDRDGKLKDVDLNELQFTCFESHFVPADIIGLKHHARTRLGLDEQDAQPITFSFDEFAGLMLVMVDMNQSESMWRILTTHGFKAVKSGQRVQLVFPEWISMMPTCYPKALADKDHVLEKWSRRTDIVIESKSWTSWIFDPFSLSQNEANYADIGSSSIMYCELSKPVVDFLQATFIQFDVDNDGNLSRSDIASLFSMIQESDIDDCLPFLSSKQTVYGTKSFFGKPNVYGWNRRLGRAIPVASTNANLISFDEFLKGWYLLCHWDPIGCQELLYVLGFFSVEIAARRSTQGLVDAPLTLESGQQPALNGRVCARVFCACWSVETSRAFLRCFTQVDLEQDLTCPINVIVDCKDWFKTDQKSHPSFAILTIAVIRDIAEEYANQLSRWAHSYDTVAIVFDQSSTDSFIELQDKFDRLVSLSIPRVYIAASPHAGVSKDGYDFAARFCAEMNFLSPIKFDRGASDFSSRLASCFCNPRSCLDNAAKLELVNLRMISRRRMLGVWQAGLYLSVGGLVCAVTAAFYNGISQELTMKGRRDSVERFLYQWILSFFSRDSQDQGESSKIIIRAFANIWNGMY